MLDLRFFRNPTFSSATAAINLVFFAMFGTFFLLTQYLQLVLGLRGRSKPASGCCRCRSR